MCNPKSNSWPQAILSMLGERQMQEILSLEIRSLGADALAQLKKRFQKKVRPRSKHFTAAYDRYKRLEGLETAFTEGEKKMLLALLVPKDLPHEVLVHERWMKRKPHTINDMFRNRFEHTSIHCLRAILEGSSPHQIPDGMVLAHSAVEIHTEKLEAALSELTIAFKNARARRNKLASFHKTIEKDRKNRLDGGSAMISDSIQNLLGKKATELYHDGKSTYAEPTRVGWQDIAECLNTKPMTSEDIILDLGSGSAQTLWQLCQYHGCKGIGIEYGEARLRSAAMCSVLLLKEHGSHPNFNPNVINRYENIMNLSALPPCSVLYMYDEAFPDDLMEKIFELIDDAPSRLRYIITFKANKFHEFRAPLAELRGVRAISLGNRVTKAFSGEGSQYDLYERRVRDEAVSTTSLGEEAQPFEHYWNSNIEEKAKYYYDLHDAMNVILNDEKEARTDPNMQQP